MLQRVAVLGVVAFVLGVCGASASPRIPTVALKPAREIPLRGVFGGLTADGLQAVAIPDNEDGNTSFLTVWNMKTGSSVTYRTYLHPGCSDCELSLDEVVLAGDRLAFFRYAYISHTDEYGQLLVARPGKRPVVVADSYDDSGDQGDVLQELRGDGPLLAVSWSSLDVFAKDYFAKVYKVGGGTQPCPDSPSSLTGPSARECLRVGADDADLLAVDAGRILVYDDEGVRLLDPLGRQLSTYKLGDVLNSKIELSGDTIVAGRKNGRIDLYAVDGGAKVATLAGHPNKLAAGGGFVFYTDGGVLHLVRLSDRAEVHLTLPAGETLDSLRLEPTGIFWLSRAKGHARIGFEPLARLRADFATALKQA
jgi:hypothetical protein